MTYSYILGNSTAYYDQCPECGWPSDPGDYVYESDVTGRGAYCSNHCARKAEGRRIER